MERNNNSTKRRHTKPCKYFQSGKCPYTAAACDFAHVQTYPIPPYSTPGYCDPTGCQMVPRQHPAPDPMDHYYLPSPTSPMVPYPLQIGVSYRRPPIYSPYSPDVSSSPISVFPYHPGGGGIIIPAVSSISSGIESPVTSSEDAESSTDEVVFSDSSSGYRQQPRRNQPILPPLTMPYQNPTNNNGSRGGFSPMKEGAKFQRSRSLGPSKKKAAKYKTKKCRFWAPDLGCPNGTDCTFFHGDDGKAKFKHLPDPQHNLPEKPLTVEEVNAKQGFFPISWRVIGGGVKMGVTTQDVEHEAEAVEIDSESIQLGEQVQEEPPIFRRRVRSNSMNSTPLNERNPWVLSFSAET